jgi:hypothetical protein
MDADELDAYLDEVLVGGPRAAPTLTGRLAAAIGRM